MGCESSDVVRFDLGLLLQGQMMVPKLKSAFNLLIIEKCCLSLYLIPITTVLLAEKLVKGMTLVLPMKNHEIFAQVLLKYSLLKSSTEVDVLESKKCSIPAILLKMMIWTCWGMMWRQFLDLKQTLRVLLKAYCHLLHAPNPYVLSLCL